MCSITASSYIIQQCEDNKSACEPEWERESVTVVGEKNTELIKVY